jgi:hypothetical protein
MLHNVRSELLAGEIRITRPADNRGGRPRAQPDQR